MSPKKTTPNRVTQILAGAAAILLLLFCLRMWRVSTCTATAHQWKCTGYCDSWTPFPTVKWHNDIWFFRCTHCWMSVHREQHELASEYLAAVKKWCGYDLLPASIEITFEIPSGDTKTETETTIIKPKKKETHI